MSEHIKNGLCEKTAVFLEESLGLEECKECEFFSECCKETGASEESIKADWEAELHEEKKELKLKEGSLTEGEVAELCAEEESDKPELKLIGADGNVFNILGLAMRAARQAGWSKEKIEEFKKKAMSGDYNNAIATCQEYFDVS